MKLIIDNVNYIPFYKSFTDFYEPTWDELIVEFKKLHSISKSSFQLMFDALSTHINYWEFEGEQVLSRQDFETLMFEFNGLDFYKFFYNSNELREPTSIINTYDGTYMQDDKIKILSFKLETQQIEFIIENDTVLIMDDKEFREIFKIDNEDDYQRIVLSLKKNSKLYFDGASLFFINEKNYTKVMLYMIEQINLLNEIYGRLKLPQISII